jgi:hypothetical protein
MEDVSLNGRQLTLEVINFVELFLRGSSHYDQWKGVRLEWLYTDCLSALGLWSNIRVVG